MLSFTKSLVGGAVAATALWAVVGVNAQTTTPAAPSATPPAPAASAKNTPHGKGQRHPHGFKSLDANKDGLLSADELKAFHAAH